MTDYGRAYRLDGKVGLVSGAARGIGAEVAAAFAQAGAAVLVTDVLEEPGRQTVEAIRNGGGKAEFLKHDVTDEKQWEAAVAEAVRKFGRLDVLVNNAGVEKMARITECSVEEFRWIQEVNVTGVFLGLKHGIRAMAPGGASGHGGSIVNLSSVAGLRGTIALGAYCASKGAVRLLTKSAAIECAQLKTGVRVNSIHPGLIWTKMGEQFLSHYVDLKLIPDFATAEAAFKTRTPMGRFGEPSDIASAALYLASDASKFVTGAELVVDGGYSAS
jgi:NAD(P)-dependent dehydrogenase (short-subunit alcohol dehydrogenase family)